MNLLVRKESGRILNLGGKNAAVAFPGDIIRIETPGGGGMTRMVLRAVLVPDTMVLHSIRLYLGWGKPGAAKRKPEQVDDLGNITKILRREAYGSLKAYSDTQNTA